MVGRDRSERRDGKANVAEAVASAVCEEVGVHAERSNSAAHKEGDGSAG